jgi:hypothetical protein
MRRHRVLPSEYALPPPPLQELHLLLWALGAMRLLPLPGWINRLATRSRLYMARTRPRHRAAALHSMACMGCASAGCPLPRGGLVGVLCAVMCRLHRVLGLDGLKAWPPNPESPMLKPRAKKKVKPFQKRAGP